jgi:hypothetical protein
VAAEIVGDDDVARCQTWGELLFDVSEKQFAINRTVEQARRGNTIMTQACNEGGCHPVPVWHVANHSLAAWRTAVAAGHIGCHPAFVDENQLAGVEFRLSVAPRLPLCGDIRTVLLRGVLGLFLRVKSSWRSVFHMPRWLIDT